MLISGCASSDPTDQPSASPKTHHSAPRSKHHRKKHHHPTSRPVSGGIPTSDFPRPALTPGVTLAVGPAQICVSGYSASVRYVPTSESDAVYRRYGVEHVPYAHEVDHLISLELGGSNAIQNLWPEPYAGRWGARTKDLLENRLHDLVCSGQLPLRRAQHMEATNWIAAYRRYVGSRP
jgi:5-methylcytosine-specific restriction endonuclease McrA